MSRIANESVIEKARAICERVGSQEGLEIVEVDLVGGGRNRVLRIYIDKPGGVTHADCEKVSHQVGEILDVEDVIPGAGYTLEVSSPGVERKLSKPRDFERFVGEKVKVSLRAPLENQRHWQGMLAAFANGTVTLETAPGKSIQFPLEQVERANLKFEW
jgi:ribosome maturation factor RimP